MDKLDLLTPFRHPESNRQETLLVEWDMIQNRAAQLVISMLSNPNRWLKKYPNISKFFNKSKYQVYEETKLLSPYSVMISLIGDNVEDFTYEDILDDMRYLEKIDVSSYLPRPVFSFGLNRMLGENCFRKAFIVKEREYTDWEIKLIKDMYSVVCDKLDILEGNMTDIYDENKADITTIFNSHISLPLKISKIEGHEEFTKKQLFILKISESITRLNENSGKLEYTCGEILKDLESKAIHTSIIQFDSLLTEDDGVPLCITK